MFVVLSGILLAICLGALAGLLWTPLGWAVFIVVALCWLGLAVDAILRQMRTNPAALLEANRYWPKEDLPEEFRFINHETTVQQIVEKIGTYKRIRGDGEIRALEYHLPYGSAVLVFPELPIGSRSRVRAVKFYLDHNEIPLF
jgi:hypothetical protein